MKKQKSLASSAALMGVIILLAKVMGLLRDILVGANFGLTEAAVAYETASKLPVTVFDFVLGGVVTSAFIPIYNSLAVKKSKKDALSFAYSYVNLVLLITLSISVLGVVFAPTLVKIIAPDLSQSASALAVELTRIMFPMVVAVGLAFSFVGFLQSEGEYNIPAVISLVSNLIMVGYLLFFSGRFGIKGLAAAMLIGWSAQAVVQIPAVIRHGFRYKPLSPVATPEIGHALKNSLPILLSTWVTPVCNLINTSIASGIDSGRAITALGYSNRLYIIIVGVFSFVATNLLFPYFAKAAASGNTGESSRLTRSSIRILVFILAPISVGIMMLAGPFVSLVYERQAFTAADTVITASALRCYAVGMIFTAVCEVLTKAFFAIEKTKIPMVSALISMAFNVSLVLILGEKLSVGGIALLSGLSAGVNMAVNLAFAVKQKLITPEKSDVIDIAKSLISAFVMGAAVYSSSLFINGGKILSFALPTMIGVVVYAVMTVLVKSEEMQGILSVLKKKRGAE